MLQKLFLGVIIFYYMYITNVNAVINLDLDWEQYPFDTQLYEDVLDPELCQQQLTYLRTDTALLMRFLDAGIRMPRGILTGNTVDLGNFHQCLAIDEKIEDMSISGKYCRILVPVEQSLQLFNFLDQYDIKFDPSELEIDIKTRRHLNAIDRQKIALNLGPAGDDMNVRTGPESPLAGTIFSLATCIPRPCTTQQAIQGLLFNLTNVQFSDISCRLPNDRPWGAAEYTARLRPVFSTCYDIYQTIYLKKGPRDISTAYTSFSVYSNTRHLLTFKSSPGTLECLDGIRVLSIIWVIIGHSFTTVPQSINPIESFEWSISARGLWVTSSPFAVDTFFFLSGLLLVYTTVGKLERMELLKKLHLFYLNRLLRMFPILAAVILFEASFFMHISDGPLWNSIAVGSTKCKKFWWSTLIYLQNYINPDDMCIPVSWYLAIDVQLHILSPIVLFWVLTSKRSAWTALTTSLLVTLTASTVFNFLRNFQSTIISPNRPQDGGDYFKYYYINTLTRASPLLVGMIYGYLLHQWRNTNMKIPKIFSTSSMLLSLLSILVVMYCGYIPMGLNWNNQLADNFFNSFLRPIWAMALGWIVLACVQGRAGPINWFLSLQMWKLPARISYAMYLIHGSMMTAFYSSIITPLYFSVSYVFFNFMAFMLLTFILSFLVTLLIDSPFSIIFKLLLGKGFKKSETHTPKLNDNDCTKERNGSFSPEENNKNL